MNPMLDMNCEPLNPGVGTTRTRSAAPPDTVPGRALTHTGEAVGLGVPVGVAVPVALTEPELESVNDADGDPPLLTDALGDVVVLGEAVNDDDAVAGGVAVRDTVAVGDAEGTTDHARRPTP